MEVCGRDSGWGLVAGSCEHGIHGTDVLDERYVSIIRVE
jgi:hypothetical protein